MEQNKPVPVKLFIMLGVIICLIFLLKSFKEKEIPYTKIEKVETPKVILPTNFDFVYERFKVFNPEIDTATVVLFNEVCEYYQLDTNQKLLELCVGQILLESGAKQHKGDKLVQSYAGAVGIGQIMPNTAYGILRGITPDDAGVMLKLGSTPFYYKRYDDKGNMRAFSKSWITNKRNNIIMWGHIMSTNLKKRPNMYKALVSYNAGTGGMLRFINNGGSIHQHKYVKGIFSKLRIAERSL